MSEKTHPRVEQHISDVLAKMREREEQYKNRHKHIRTEEDIKKEREYWDRVWASKPTNPVIRLPKLPQKSHIPYELARVKLAQVAKQRAAASGRQFNLKGEEPAIWRETLKWIIFDRTSKIPLTQDLFLFGGTGAGKTFLAQCLMEVANHFAPTAHFSERDQFKWGFIELNTLYEDCLHQKSFDPMTPKFGGNWIFDELINEPRSIKIYSNESRFFEKILTKREQGQSPKRAIYISNAVPSDLSAYYASDRFDSRWKARIGKSIFFNSNDKRI